MKRTFSLHGYLVGFLHQSKHGKRKFIYNVLHHITESLVFSHLDHENKDLAAFLLQSHTLKKNINMHGKQKYTNPSQTRGSKLAVFSNSRFSFCSLPPNSRSQTLKFAVFENFLRKDLSFNSTKVPGESQIVDFFINVCNVNGKNANLDDTRILGFQRYVYIYYKQLNLVWYF